MEGPRRRLDPKAASLAGFVSPGPTGRGSGKGGGNGGAGGGGGGWKARLKERCLNRVRQERERLVQEMRGMGSPTPGSSCLAAGENRPLLPSPPPQLAGTPFAAAAAGPQEQRRASTPSSLSGAALSILQDEMRAARREQQQLQQEGEVGMMVVASGTQEGEGEGEGPDGAGALSAEEHWALMQCIEEALAAEVALAEERLAGEYSQLESAEVEGAVAQLYDYEALHAAGPDVAVLCPRCRANYLHLSSSSSSSRPGSAASSTSTSSGGSSAHHACACACACGLRLELPPGLGGLPAVQERLAAAYGHHRTSGCPVREPGFYQREPARGLWVGCGTCGLDAQVV